MVPCVYRVSRGCELAGIWAVDGTAVCGEHRGLYVNSLFEFNDGVEAVMVERMAAPGGDDLVPGLRRAEASMAETVILCGWPVGCSGRATWVIDGDFICDGHMVGAIRGRAMAQRDGRGLRKVTVERLAEPARSRAEVAKDLRGLAEVANLNMTKKICREAAAMLEEG